MIGLLVSKKPIGSYMVLRFIHEGKFTEPSIFADQATNLMVGKTYIYETENREYQGKTYLNIKAKFRGKKKVGYEIDESVLAAPKAALVTDYHPVSPTPLKDDKPIVTRLSCLNTASQLVKELMAAGTIKTRTDAINELLQVAQACEKWAKEAKI